MSNKLIVHHKTDGHGEFIKCPPQERRIVQRYDDGRVKDHVGDVWFVRMGKDNAYHTVR
jgi:hypothetical protein